MATHPALSLRTPERPRESRSFKARLERELAKTQRITGDNAVDCISPKEATVRLPVSRNRPLPKAPKSISPCKSAKILRQPAPTVKKSVTNSAEKPVPRELRKLREMLKGVSPIPPKAKDTRDASPISDFLPSTETQDLDARQFPRTLSEKRVPAHTVAVYTSKGLRIYELRKV